jgi:hypothetical protein
MGASRGGVCQTDARIYTTPTALSGQRGERRRGGVQSREESGRAGGVIQGVGVMVLESEYGYICSWKEGAVGVFG